MQEVRGMAKEHGIKASRMTKVDLIKTIQITEGNFDCFSSATSGECDQLDCVWREDCFALAKKLHS
jgi:hypothetical protein